MMPQSAVRYPSYIEFTSLLKRKKEGEPLIFWHKENDLLTALIGEGDCRSYTIGGYVCPHLDILIKRSPSETSGSPEESGEDPFAGFQISGGIQKLLRRHFKGQSGLSADYEAYKKEHNEGLITIYASSLFNLWISYFGEKARPGPRVRIRAALEKQNPKIYIPL